MGIGTRIMKITQGKINFSVDGAEKSTKVIYS